MSGKRASGRRFGHKTRACHGDGFLRKEPRQFVRARGEVDPPLSAGGHIFQKRRVGIRLAAKTDDAHGDPERFERLEQPLVLARLFRVRRVREQHDVPRPLLGLLNHFCRRDQRRVGEDAAAHGLDAPDVVTDLLLLARRCQRTDHVWRAVDGDHADLVEGSERLDRRAGPEIGQIHLRPAVTGRRRHAAGTIENDRHRERQLAMLVLDFHRHRQIRVEDRLEVPAHPVRRGAAGQQQSTTDVADKVRQCGERLRPRLAGRHVLQDRPREKPGGWQDRAAMPMA